MRPTAQEPVDVVVLGEPLLEHHRDAAGAPTAPDAVSGDAVNAACAAAAAGARVALLAVLGADAAGDQVVAHLRARGVVTEHVLRADRPTGAYTVVATGAEHAFTYQRAGSAAATMAPDLLVGWGGVLDAADLVVTSGITGAISPSARALLGAVARRVDDRGGRLVFDVNHRPALSSAADAAGLLARVAPRCALVKIASPADSRPLLRLVEPEAVAAAVERLGARAVVVTAGEEPLLLAERGRRSTHPVEREAAVVDTTGAGDVLLGTLVAGLARGAVLREALPPAMRAAAASTRSRGGSPAGTTGIATSEEAVVSADHAGGTARAARPPQ